MEGFDVAVDTGCRATVRRCAEAGRCNGSPFNAANLAQRVCFTGVENEHRMDVLRRMQAKYGRRKGKGRKSWGKKRVVEIAEHDSFFTFAPFPFPFNVSLPSFC